MIWRCLLISQFYQAWAWNLSDLTLNRIFFALFQNRCLWILKATYLLLTPLSFQCTAGKVFSLTGNFLCFQQPVTGCLFVAMVTPYPGGLFENFGLEGVFMLTSLFPGQTSLLCLRPLLEYFWRWGTRHFSLLMTFTCGIRDSQASLMGGLSIMGGLGSPQQWGPQSIPGRPRSSSEGSGSAGRSQPFGMVSLWQLLWIMALLDSGIKNVGHSPLRWLQLYLAFGAAKNRMQVWLVIEG